MATLLSPSTKQRAVIVSTIHPHSQAAQQIGQQAYSYYFVAKAFAPLLERWGCTVEIDRPESRLDFALWRARQQNLTPLHLGFQPLNQFYISSQATNIAFPFWEFPNLPNADVGYSSRNNWVKVANHLDLILTASTFTRDTFIRAGVQTPVRVVPVPIRPEYFDVPAWEIGQRIQLDCPCYVFPEAATKAFEPNPWVPEAADGVKGFLSKVRRGYKGALRPRLPNRLNDGITLAVRTARFVRNLARPKVPQLPAPRDGLELSGIVYTTLLNPFDPRKNWRDLLTAYLFALRDRTNATLVVKLIVGKELAPLALDGMIGYYRGLGITHSCKLVFVTEYLSDPQMIELARGSTYYLCASHAEGACLPLQDLLAAARPGIAPTHTALVDYFDERVGFTVNSHPEPAAWPNDPTGRLSTSWRRLDWQSLHDQIATSYETASRGLAEYNRLARHSRERMMEYASLEAVWPRFAGALDAALDGGNLEPQRLEDLALCS